MSDADEILERQVKNHGWAVAEIETLRELLKQAIGSGADLLATAQTERDAALKRIEVLLSSVDSGEEGLAFIEITDEVGAALYCDYAATPPTQEQDDG